VVVLLALAVAAIEPAAAQQRQHGDPDWPCVQALVPSVSGAMIWAGPPIESAAESWRDDPAVRDLAAELAARRTPIEEAQRRIEGFAASLDPEVRDEKLTALFAGVLETINRDRASIIAGIKRFARKQRALGEEVRQANAALRELAAAGDGAPEQRERRRELEERRNWGVRIFDEREASLAYLCEQPVVLEQRAFTLAREIAAHLE
jgi:hypothetical protein